MRESNDEAGDDVFFVGHAGRGCEDASGGSPVVVNLDIPHFFGH